MPFNCYFPNTHRDIFNFQKELFKIPLRLRSLLLTQMLSVKDVQSLTPVPNLGKYI